MMISKEKQPIIIIFLLYIVTVGYLYYVHYTIYGTAIETGFQCIALIPIISLVIHIFFSEKQIKNEKLNNNLAILFWALLWGILLLSLFWLYKNPYILLLYFYVAAFLIYLFMRKPDKNKSSINLIGIMTIFLAIFIITIVFQLFSGVYTLNQAKSELQNEKYTNLEYIGTSKPEMVSTLFAGTANLKYSGLTELEKKVDFYLFYGEVNDKKYGLFFSPLEGTLTRQYEISDKKELENYKH